MDTLEIRINNPAKRIGNRYTVTQSAVITLLKLLLWGNWLRLKYSGLLLIALVFLGSFTVGADLFTVS